MYGPLTHPSKTNALFAFGMTVKLSPMALEDIFDPPSLPPPTFLNFQKKSNDMNGGHE
jgi:hypothetical protein